MATKKKTKTQTRSKKRTKSKSSANARTTRKGPAKKKSVRAKPAARTKAVAKKTRGVKSRGTATRRTPKRNPLRADLTFSPPGSDSDSAGQSGDLQGLSNVESADSESVDELIEEGNAFEAGVVTGVEEAGDRGEREVRTREVPEDDVPGEYLDEE
ncbi:MAG: hypothetical protein WB711_01940 [Terriglobales bacterium]